MHSKALYTVLAPLYDMSVRLNDYPAAIERAFREVPLPVDAAIRILDVGCGSGLYARLALVHWPKATVLATDSNPQMIAAATRELQRAGVMNRSSLTVASVEELSKAVSGTYDLTIAAGVLEYANLPRAVEQLWHIAAPGGYVVHGPVADIPLNTLTQKVFGFRSHGVANNQAAFLRQGFQHLKTIPLRFRRPTLSAVRHLDVYQKP